MARVAELTQPARILARIERVAAVLGALGALLYLLRSPAGALVLTLTAAASIVAFHGLQGLVGGLGAGSDTKVDQRSKGLVWLRFCLLLVIPLTSLWLDAELALSLLLGFSVIPLSFIGEGFFQLFLSLMSRGENGS